MTVTTHPHIHHNPNRRPHRAANQCKTQCQPLTMGPKTHVLGLIVNIIIHHTLYLLHTLYLSSSSPITSVLFVSSLLSHISSPAKNA
ncbi:hypothetical protein AMTRI_Chr02g264840 [Amborella trichopoda]